MDVMKGNDITFELAGYLCQSLKCFYVGWLLIKADWNLQLEMDKNIGTLMQFFEIKGTFKKILKSIKMNIS